MLFGQNHRWEMIIGLEIHAQIRSKTKLFSAASTCFGAEPNSQVSFIDAGFPGMLPVINEFCIEQAVRTGLGLKAQINQLAVFDRKNYFYPDLPSGYQISQYSQPIVGRGQITIELPENESKSIGITRLHLEMDAGKSLHDQHPTQTYIDLNRSGIALMEIVTEPDLRSGIEAATFIRKLRNILRYLGTCDGNMEKGSLRCDANISVHEPGTPFGTRCEIKNLNSIRFVQQAIDYEAQRQIKQREQQKDIEQETRLWDPNQNVTYIMRSKEEAHDYRYFPDPDLVPLKLDPAWIQRIQNTLPELPDEKKQRFMRDYRISDYDADILVADKNRADFFEKVVTGFDPKLVVSWINTVLFGALNKADLELEQSPVSVQDLKELLALIVDNTLSGRIAKDVFEEMFKTGQSASTIVDQKGLRQITDADLISAEIDAVFAIYPDKLSQFRAGKEKLFTFFIGQVMKRTQGKANPQMVNQILHSKLTESA